MVGSVVYRQWYPGSMYTVRIHSPPDNYSKISTSHRLIDPQHRKRILTKEKAKVVVASWGTEFLPFLAALAILNQDDLKNRLICTRTS